MLKNIVRAASFLLFGCVTDPAIENAVPSPAVEAEGLRLDGVRAFAADPRLGQEVDRICFARNIEGFTTTSRDTLVIRTSPNTQFLVEVSGTCPSLLRAQTVAVDSTLSCVTPGDFLIVSESPVSLRNRGVVPDRCAINRIFTWDPKERPMENGSPQSARG